MDAYKIVRFYKDSTRSKVIAKGLTLKEAQEHCNNHKTRKNQNWFEGYTKE